MAVNGNGQEICDPVNIVIFGASGDLTQRKLIPALYNLHLKKRLPEAYRIIGVSRTTFSDDEFRDKVRSGVEEHSAKTFDAAMWREFAQRVHYLPGNATEASSYQQLDTYLAQWEESHANRLYYLSTAPSLYEPTLNNLKVTGMADEAKGWRRIVIEKPFGYDLATAHALNDIVHKAFAESQVYRIDHYLGKETAQNILYFRFANTIFEPIWSRDFISNVQISVLESVDVGRRADFYDGAGVMRDMFQNHLMQLLTLTAMEPPISLKADDLRAEKAKVLSALRMPKLSDTVRAQYDGYCATEGVAENSMTPTYAALKLYVDNWRWEGVPFYLRSGKALKRKASEIIVEFRRPPLRLFDVPRNERSSPNRLSICIQPDEGIHLKFDAKLPDTREGRPVDMEFHYATAFGKNPIPEAYERLLLDALLGDAGLFAREDEIEGSWRLIDHVIHNWEQDPHALPMASYAPGTWGPVEAVDLLDAEGHHWHMGCIHDENGT